MFGPRCDHVPAGAAFADQIQRGESASQIIGLVVRGGCRRYQTDVPGDHGQGRQQRHRFQFEHVPAGSGQRATGIIALTNAGPIGEEDHIELATLGDLGAAHVMLDMQRAVGWHIRMTPGGRVVTVAAYRQAKPHFASRHRSVPPGNMAGRIRPRPCSATNQVAFLVHLTPRSNEMINLSACLSGDREHV